MEHKLALMKVVEDHIHVEGHVLEDHVEVQVVVDPAVDVADEAEDPLVAERKLDLRGEQEDPEDQEVDHHVLEEVIPPSVPVVVGLVVAVHPDQVEALALVVLADVEEILDLPAHDVACQAAYSIQVLDADLSDQVEDPQVLEGQEVARVEDPVLVGDPGIAFLEVEVPLVLDVAEVALVGEGLEVLEAHFVWVHSSCYVESLVDPDGWGVVLVALLDGPYEVLAYEDLLVGHLASQVVAFLHASVDPSSFGVVLLGVDQHG